jgi:hypothetical protein
MKVGDRVVERGRRAGVLLKIYAPHIQLSELAEVLFDGDKIKTVGVRLKDLRPESKAS